RPPVWSVAPPGPTACGAGSRRPPVVLGPPDRSPGAARASPAMTRTRASLVLLGVSVLGVVSGVRAEPASRSAEGPSSTSGRGGVGYFAYGATASLPGTQFPDQGNLHIASPESPHQPYNSDPPTSGPHLPYIAPWGVHTRPIPRELQVHNLEDGGVVVQYNCECPDIAAKLKAVVQRSESN